MEPLCEHREAGLVLWHHFRSSLEQVGMSFPPCPTRGCWTCPVVVTWARRGQDRGVLALPWLQSALPCRRNPPSSPLLHYYFPPSLNSSPSASRGCPCWKITLTKAPSAVIT